MPQVALRALGFPVKKADVTELLRQQGEEETGQLDFRYNIPYLGV
jgi:hypothetical protein